MTKEGSNIIYNGEKATRARQNDLFMHLQSYIDQMSVAEQDPSAEARNFHRIFKARAMEIVWQLSSTFQNNGNR